MNYYNSKWYITLCNNNEFKALSLNDNVYFTMRDIFINCVNVDVALFANVINGELSGNISYEERTSEFKYSNMLNNKKDVKEILNLLESLNNSDFCNKNSDKLELIDSEYTTKYSYKLLEFDIWFEQLKTLITNLREHYNTL